MSVRAAHDAVETWLREEGPEPSLSLVEGAHLRQGARYTSADGDLDLILMSWQPRTETAIRFASADAESNIGGTASLKSVSSPAELVIDGWFIVSAGWLPSLHAASGTVRADLKRWWTETSASGPAPITARGRHKLGRGTAKVRLLQGDDREWQVSVTIDVRGPFLLRPLAAIVWFHRKKLQQELDATLKETAERWNGIVPGLLTMNETELHDLISAGLRKR